jgi:hypothetical protein
MYRLATVLALFTMLLAGCGGGGDKASDSSSSAVAQTPETPSKDKSKDDSAAKKDGKKKKDNHKQAKDKADEKTDDDSDSAEKPDLAGNEEEFAENLEKAPRKGVAKVIRFAVDGALAFHSLKLARLEIRDRGRDLTVVVTRKSACNALAGDEPAIRQRIQQGAPVVKTVDFQVAGTGEELGYYVLRCKRPEIPNGPGTVVWERTAVGGPVTSEKFKVTRKKWALEYESLGNSLAAVVVCVGGPHEGEYFKPVGLRKPGAGRNIYKGPGTFQIQVHGGGRWTLRAKEMG